MLQTWEYDPSLLFFLSFLSVKYGPKIPFINKMHHTCIQSPETEVKREIKEILEMIINFVHWWCLQSSPLLTRLFDKGFGTYLF